MRMYQSSHIGWPGAKEKLGIAPKPVTTPTRKGSFSTAPKTVIWGFMGRR